MLSRRVFAGCALCAIGGLQATAVSAQQPAAQTGFTRTTLQQIDGPTPGYVTIIAIGEVEPGVTVPRHTHPGVESGYFLEGGGELQISGQSKQQLLSGQSYQVPVGTPHLFVNGSKYSKFCSTYVVEKDKPFASPA